MVKKENVDLYQEEANIGATELMHAARAAMDFQSGEERSKRYSQPTRAEIRQKNLAALPNMDIVIRQVKILVKLVDDTTPPVYKDWDAEIPEIPARFLKVEDDTLAFDPDDLPEIP